MLLRVRRHVACRFGSSDRAARPDPGIAFPFGALMEREGSFQVAELVYEGDAALALWSDHAQGAGRPFGP